MAWKLYTCDISGKSAQVLVDRGYEKKAPIIELSHLSWFGIYCNEAPGNSFWNPIETEALNEIEDDFLKICEAFGHGRVVYVLRIATAGIRAYYIYHSDKAEIIQVFESLKAVHPTYRIEMDTMDDPEWNGYRKYVSFIVGKKSML